MAVTLSRVAFYYLCVVCRFAVHNLHNFMRCPQVTKDMELKPRASKRKLHEIPYFAYPIKSRKLE